MIKRITSFVFGNSLLLIAGAVAGLLLANTAPSIYSTLVHLAIPLPWLAGYAGQHAELGIHYLVNDVLMAFFFAAAGKEVWEALLPGGCLRNPRQAALPVLCAVGGMAGPALIYIMGAWWLGQVHTIGRGWAIPCATDIAFSYIVVRIIFGKEHPATPFLLLLAIVDDALGLLVLAVFYPQKALAPLWLLLAVAGVLIALAMRRGGVRVFWWYVVLPGALCWIGFAKAGVHPALALLPIIPTLPHGRTGEATVHWGESEFHETLDKFADWWARPVDVILCLFGVLNAGVALTAFTGPSYLVLVAMLVGKPIGIVLTGMLAGMVLGFRLPDGLGWRQMWVVGIAAGIGFTVALFVTTVAFGPGSVQDAAKMGALSSCLSGVVAILAAKLLGIRRQGRVQA